MDIIFIFFCETQCLMPERPTKISLHCDGQLSQDGDFFWKVNIILNLFRHYCWNFGSLPNHTAGFDYLPLISQNILCVKMCRLLKSTLPFTSIPALLLSTPANTRCTLYIIIYMHIAQVFQWKGWPYWTLVMLLGSAGHQCKLWREIDPSFVRIFGGPNFFWFSGWCATIYMHKWMGWQSIGPLLLLLLLGSAGHQSWERNDAVAYTYSDTNIHVQIHLIR